MKISQVLSILENLAHFSITCLWSLRSPQLQSELSAFSDQAPKTQRTSRLLPPACNKHSSKQNMLIKNPQVHSMTKTPAAPVSFEQEEADN